MAGTLRVRRRQSSEGGGTLVSIELPTVDPPPWFATEIALRAPQADQPLKILVLDDDSAVHQIWEQRFSLLREKVHLTHVSTPAQFKELGRASIAGVSEFLFDQELLGFDETGLDLIESLEIAERTLLVTSGYDSDSFEPSTVSHLKGIVSKDPPI